MSEDARIQTVNHVSYILTLIITFVYAIADKKIIT